MKRTYILLIFCLLILSIFVSCDELLKKPQAIIITLDSGVLEEKATIISTVKDERIILSSGETIWGTDKYSFLGWATAKNGEVLYRAGASFSSSSDATLYAIWEENPKITYLSNGGTGDTVTEYHKRGENIKINDSSFTKEGWGFSSWNTSADESGTKYIVGQEIILTESLTLYAVWSKDIVTLSYKANGGEGTIESKAVVPDTEVTLSDGTGFTYTNFTLVAWCTTSDGEGTCYGLGSSVAIKEDTVLYAIWMDKTTNLTFSLNADGNTYSAKTLYKGLNGSVVIPSSYMDKSVTSISDEGFADCANIISIIIPDTVTRIGENAFSNCSNLASITLGNSIESVGSYAFNRCTKLKSISFSRSIKTISSNAFSGCTGLQAIYIDKSKNEIEAFSLDIPSAEVFSEDEWQGIIDNQNWNVPIGIYGTKLNDASGVLVVNGETLGTLQNLTHHISKEPSQINLMV